MIVYINVAHLYGNSCQHVWENDETQITQKSFIGTDNDKHVISVYQDPKTGSVKAELSNLLCLTTTNII